MEEVSDIQQLHFSDEITTEVSLDGVVTRQETDGRFVPIHSKRKISRDALHGEIPNTDSVSTLVGPEGDVPFEHYATRDSLALPRSRHASGEPDLSSTARRGSANFVPHMGHLLSRDSFTSLASLGNATRQDSTPTVVTDDDPPSSIDVFDAMSSDYVNVRDDLHAHVEGTLDWEFARDARLLRQLSAELTRERERDRERRRRLDDWFVAALVGAALALAAAWFVSRRKR